MVNFRTEVHNKQITIWIGLSDEDVLNSSYYDVI